MFRKTKTEPQLGLFSSPNLLLSSRLENLYQDKAGWHNLFRSQVTNRIDESICKPLYAKDTGTPNASIRVLIAMMSLKEANGWSDSVLFESCRFNLLIRSSLGLMNMDDAVPTESTYYLFRKKVVEYEKLNGINLVEKTFISLTKGQSIDFEVSGKSIRMDSKLLGSNIAWLSRYELIHETLRLFCQNIKENLFTHPLLADQKDVIENLLKEKGNKVVYRSTSLEVKTKMQQLGLLAYTLIQIYNYSGGEHFTTLNKVFNEQFKMDADTKTIISLSKEEIKSNSVQSPHDTDCHYRNKDGNQVKGYSINVSESCDSEGLNLISGVEVREVSAADNDFLQSGVKQAKEIFIDDVKQVHTDGAYHSVSNQEFCESENIDLLLNAIQGAKGRFDLFPGEDNKLTVVDTLSGESIEATKLKEKEKWRIKVDGCYRYFTQKTITASLLKRKIADIPQSILNIRNNVEATIFQLGYHYPNDKSRYRGLIKHKMWANIRSIWVNFVRILNYISKKTSLIHFWSNYRSINKLITQILANISTIKLILGQPLRFSQKINFIR